jgi:DNA-binding transcriptional MerR regulator
MPTLDELLATRPSMSLDELTDAANALLPAYLPDDPVDARVTDTVNARLVRHYVSEGVLDGASRDGKKAVYFVDHLLQLLALRRLLADGVSAGSIGDALTRLDRDTLRAIAEGTVGTEALATRATAPSKAEDRRARAAAALAQIRARSGGGPTPATAATHTAPIALSGLSVHRLTAPSEPPPDAPTHWDRVPLLDGIELHVRSDVRLPDRPAARQKLLDQVIREIVLYAQRRGS